MENGAPYMHECIMNNKLSKDHDGTTFCSFATEGESAVTKRKCGLF